MAETPRTTTPKKAPAKRTSTARKPAAAKTTTTPVVEPTTVEVVQTYAEKAVVIPVGAALIARDRVATTVEELQTKYGTRAAAEKQLAKLRKDVAADLKKAERRGTTARKSVQRDIKKTRTQVERELRQRRAKAERELKARRTQVEKELKAFRADVEKQVKTVTTRVEPLVDQANKVATDVSNTVTERVSSLA
jgi:F0F1-type ATP synthase membrane subunit b/b'